jgi:gas vesicle protein
MNDNTKSALPLLIIAASLGAIAGALSVLLARKESREYLRERGAKGLEYVNQAGAKLRESSAGLREKGREFMNRCCATTDSAAHAEHGDKPEIH